MRCLYCGKELALLKRWTGGGEFCSDAHRQQYQEEYNQLALNRLLQAKPLEPKPGTRPAESKPAEGKVAEPKGPETRQPVPVAAPVAAPPAPVAPAQVRAIESAPTMAAALEAPKPEPEFIEPEPVEAEPEEERAPADPAGFLLEVPIPVFAGVSSMAQQETDFERPSNPTLPSLTLVGWGTELVAAGQVMFEPSIRVMDCASRTSEGRVEVREFVRGAPVVEFDMHASGETGLVETSEEPMDILIFPHPPQGSPPLWLEPDRPFTFDMELGPKARVAFRTTGLQDNEDGEGEPVAEAPAGESQVDEPKKEEPKKEAGQPVVAEQKQAAPKPDVAKPPAVRSTPPVFLKPSFSSFLKPSPARPAPLAEKSAVAEKPAVVIEKPAVMEKPAEKVPDVATKPLPLTLHGLAAGRGKPVQVFPSAVASGVDLQIPRSTALPLRPVIVLGPAPAAAKQAPKEEKKPERTVLIKPDPRKRPDPRFGSGKNRKPEPEKAEPEKKAPPAAAAVKETPAEAAQKQPAAPVAEPVKAAAQALVKPEPKAEPAKESPKESPKEASKEQVKQPVREEVKQAPAPMPTPVEPADLGLPSLSLDAGGSFWTKLPLGGKIGAALLVALVIGGIFYAMSKGGGPAQNSTPTVVEAAPALPAAEEGWITDWGAEPGVRKQHEMSILRASMNLTDYRLEFEAQIESKALGWVYRAKDPKNYYVTKLEIVKPGLDPTVALVRFAVINGEEQPRAQFPLSLPVHIDTLYKIRFDAVGNRFTTYVQDQKVDEWTDERIKTGGIGLYNERGEARTVKGGVSVVPLVIKR